MKNFRKVMMVFLITNMIVGNLMATTIRTETGRQIEVGDGKPFGVSHGYDPNATWDDIKRDAGRRYRDLRREAIELEEIHRRSNDRAQRDRIAEQLRQIQLEMDKNKADRDFEDELSRHPDRPQTRPEEGNWRRRMRRERMEELERRQRQHEEEERRRRERASRVSELGDIGSTSIGEMSDAHGEVMTDIENQDEVNRRYDEQNCDKPGDDNAEACNEIQVEMEEADASIQRSEGKLKKLAVGLPFILLGSGKVIDLFKKLKEKQRKAKELNYLERMARNCEVNCGELEQAATELKEDIALEEVVDRGEFQEMQDEERKSELQGPVEAELVVPRYLSENAEVPFGNKDALPLAFGVYTGTEAKFFTSAKVVVDGETLPATYYPEAGVIKALYAGYPKKHDFKGKVVLEGVDGKVFTAPFGGKINTTKPEIKITKKGGVLTRAKFSVSVTGEFDRIEVTGVNVKPQVYTFETVQTKKEFVVKTLSNGDAHINVKASLKTKIANVGEFDGQQLETDMSGRIINPEFDYFQAAPMSKEKAELGFCCEAVGAITCEGCIAGKRTRKSCKALNKLPGYNFKAFLRASDLSCTEL